MRRRLVFFLLAIAGPGIGVSGDLPPAILLLARFKQKVRQDAGRLANCTCLETIERAVRQPGVDAFLFLDRIRLEITTAGGKELLAWPGGERFEDWAVTSFVDSGLVANGMFGSYTRNLFLNDAATFQYRGAEELEGRQTVRYDFKVPVLGSYYKLRNGQLAAAVATKGSFWFDAGSLQLFRLDQLADDIPAGLGLTASLTRIRYERMPEVPEVLIPQSAEIELRHPSGEVRRNKIQFAQCREYRAESSISFGSTEPGTAASHGEPARVDLPAGLKIKMELESGFDSATAAIGDPIRARVVEAVRHSGQEIVPKGAMAIGRIRGMERQARAGGFVVGIELTGLRWANSRADLRAELLQATAGDVKQMRSQGAAGNIVGLGGAPPVVDIPDNSGRPSRTPSRITGAGMIFVKGEEWRLAPGLQMVWRTLTP